MMFHQVIAMIALGVGGLQPIVPEVARHDLTTVTAQPGERRFGVEFRQPEWRDQLFGSQYDMDEFIADKQRNRWDVQVFPSELRVRFRLTQWGGSRVFDNLPDAQAWVAYLERQFGYQCRIVESL